MDLDLEDLAASSSSEESIDELDQRPVVQIYNNELKVVNLEANKNKRIASAVSFEQIKGPRGNLTCTTTYLSICLSLIYSGCSH